MRKHWRRLKIRRGTDQSQRRHALLKLSAWWRLFRLMMVIFSEDQGYISVISFGSFMKKYPKMIRSSDWHWGAQRPPIPKPFNEMAGNTSTPWLTAKCIESGVFVQCFLLLYIYKYIHSVEYTWYNMIWYIYIYIQLWLNYTMTITITATINTTNYTILN